ncbi:MAG: acetate kinase [Clostridium sp.]
MNILVINCGSSSLKYQLINMTNEDVMAKGLVERIGIEGSILTHKPEGMDKVKIQVPMKDHTDAIRLVLEALIDENHGVIKNMSEIAAVGHRVVHGGEKYSASVLINDDVMKALEECTALAPLHNPPNLIGINACKDLMGDVPMIAVFDTAFHQTMPDYAYTYALPYELYKEHAVRRYGFHGTSHRFVTAVAGEMLKKDVRDMKIITCHLGNGASCAAIDGGKSVDTSMGFTPLEGLVMGTRCGDIDPAIVTYIQKKLCISAEEANDIINKKSGVLGISGISSDFRDIEEAAEEGNKRAQLALDIFHYTVRKYIGAYAAAMGGVDAIVFTAGLGENSPESRFEICKGLEFLGVKFDESKNNFRGKAEFVSADDSKVKVIVIPTNEELMIARDTKEIICK